MADYSVNYNDQRFKDVENQKQNKLNEANNMYNDMINNSENYYNQMIQASKDYENVQKQNQQAQTDFAINEINQQKEQLNKDYTKEQMGAYTDYQKESNKYGANNEKLAVQGLTNTGYSESSQVNMYNTYQNRISQARESYTLAVQKYDNAITQARLSNNEALAKIAFNSLQSQLELALQGFQYKNTLLESKLNMGMSIDSQYYQRYQDVLNQINAENQFKYQQERDRIADQQWQKQYNLSASKSSKSSSSKSSSSKSTNNGTEVKSEENKTKTQPTVQEVLSNVKMVQGANLKNNIKDGISGKTFSNMDDLLNYYGYASTNK